MAAGKVGGDVGPCIDDRSQGTERGEIAHQIGAPISTSGNRHTRGSSRYLLHFCITLPGCRLIGIRTP